MVPKVSFIVPVYNVADHVGRCVRSLCEQTLADIEIVVVDDCSPDGSVAVVERVVADYPGRKGQVRIIRHESNKGVVQARRTGLLASQGEYVLFIDGDDYADVRMAELMHGKAVETGADMVVCDMFQHCEQDKLWRLRHVPVGGAAGTEQIRDAIINRRAPISLAAKLFRRDLFLSDGIVWPERWFGEDIVMNISAVLMAKSIANVPEGLFYYVYNPKSICRSTDAARQLGKLEDLKANVALLEDLLQRHGVRERYDQSVFISKVRCKNLMLPLMKQRRYRRLYCRTYPEVNRSFLLGDRHHRPTYRERVWMAVMLLGLYPALKRIVGSRRLRPREGWV